MAYHRLVINSNPYILRDSQARDFVALAIVEAARSGGDFVHVSMVGRDVDVLVTPATDAVLETVESARPPAARAVDFDFDLDWVDFGYPP